MTVLAAGLTLVLLGSASAFTDFDGLDGDSLGPRDRLTVDDLKQINRQRLERMFTGSVQSLHLPVQSTHVPRGLQVSRRAR